MNEETNQPYSAADRLIDAVLSHVCAYFLGMVTTGAFVVIPKLIS